MGDVGASGGHRHQDRERSTQPFVDAHHPGDLHPRDAADAVGRCGSGRQSDLRLVNVSRLHCQPSESPAFYGVDRAPLAVHVDHPLEPSGFCPATPGSTWGPFSADGTVRSTHRQPGRFNSMLQNVSHRERPKTSCLDEQLCTIAASHINGSATSIAFTVSLTQTPGDRVLIGSHHHLTHCATRSCA